MGHAYLKVIKTDDVIVIWILWRHHHFYSSKHLKTSNFSNFYWIKLKFGLRVNFGTLISNFNSNENDEKGIILLILIKYILNRWSSWQNGNVYT